MRRGLVLSEALAVEIYKYKFKTASTSSEPNGIYCRGRSAAVARIFDISPKTVRDIWNHVSWKYATHQLWSKTSTTDSHVDVLSSKVYIFSVNIS